MRRTIRRAATVALVLTLAACSLPQGRSDTEISKAAVTSAEVDQVFERYREVRNAAISLLDPAPLSVVERGAVLDIDAGSFEVAERLSLARSEVPPIDVEQFVAPSFGKYPLWFVAVVNDPDAGVRRVQVFERERAVDPWLLVETPEMVSTADLPQLRTKDGAAVTVEPDNGTGMAMAAESAADAYVAALEDPTSAEVEIDDFLQQMRDSAAQNGQLDGVSFSQSWTSADVKYVLRTADGGALAFVTLLRADTYDVPPGLAVTWPEGSPQKAFLADGITETGTLRYYHQVLLQIPPGTGKPRAIGQYGGVVGTDADDAASDGGSVGDLDLGDDDR